MRMMKSVARWMSLGFSHFKRKSIDSLCSVGFTCTCAQTIHSLSLTFDVEIE